MRSVTVRSAFIFGVPISSVVPTGTKFSGVFELVTEFTWLVTVFEMMPWTIGRWSPTNSWETSLLAVISRGVASVVALFLSSSDCRRARKFLSTY